MTATRVRADRRPLPGQAAADPDQGGDRRRQRGQVVRVDGRADAEDDRQDDQPRSPQDHSGSEEVSPWSPSPGHDAEGAPRPTPPGAAIRCPGRRGRAEAGSTPGWGRARTGRDVERASELCVRRGLAHPSEPVVVEHLLEDRVVLAPVHVGAMGRRGERDEDHPAERDDDDDRHHGAQPQQHGVRQFRRRRQGR